MGWGPLRMSKIHLVFGARWLLQTTPTPDDEDARRANEWHVGAVDHESIGR